MTEKNGVERSTTTDELRRMLSRRGVEYTANERDTQWWPKDNPAGVLAENSRYPHGTLDVYGLTPEQAIAATLGSCNCTNDCTNGERTETCTADETDAMECVCDQVGRYGKCVTIHVMECSECGRTYEHVNGCYEFCPHCGRRIVEVTP